MAKSELDDWGRPEYERADLGKLVRGKYAKRLSESKRQAHDEKNPKAVKKRKAD